MAAQPDLTLTVLALAASAAVACGGNPSAPAGVGDISMIAPFVNASEMGPSRTAFSSSASAPWGFAHSGVDFFPTSSLAAFQAVADGVVTDVREWRNGDSWQVNVRVPYNSRFEVEYIFDTFSSRQADGDTQKANIAVSAGQHVTQGQAVGRLVVTSISSHVHVSLWRGGTSICPEPYFTAPARQAVLALLGLAYPNANMCY